MDTPPTPVEAPPLRPRSSLFARLLNIFAVPGEVFDEVKASPPSVANWLVPTLIFGLVAAVASYLIYSQPAIVQQIREQQMKPIEERVNAGTMTRQQGDQAEKNLEFLSGPIGKIFVSGSKFVGCFVALFWSAFLLWLIGRVLLKVPVSFMKMTEVAGLASAISILGVIVNLLLKISLSSSIASLGPVLLVLHADPSSKLVQVLAALDITVFWALFVQAIGLAKFTNVSVFKAAGCIILVVLLQVACCLGGIVGIQRVFGR